MRLRSARSAVLSVALTLAGAPLAHALVFFNEPFAYPDGTLTSVSGGLWTAHSAGGTKPIQVNGGLATLVQSPGSAEDLNRLFGATLGPGQTVYAAFDVTVSGSGPLGANELHYFTHFRSASDFVYPSRLFVTQFEGSDYTFGLGRVVPPSPATWATGFSFGETHELVFSYEFNTGIGRLWVDPVNEASASIQYTSPAFNPVYSLALRQATPGNVVTVNQVIGDLRVGTSFDDLYLQTVPEPSSFLLIGVGLFGGLVRARRRLKKIV